MSDDKKKWFLLAILIVLTISLIYVFRMKDLGRFVTEQQKNITSFYTANLRPLIAQIPFTNDDIFNFAFHKRLPLNYEKNRFLVLGNEQGGGGYFEFTHDIPDDYKNLDNYASTLGLDEVQKATIDSILDSYKERIEEQVLVNENNTMAINSGLWNLNRAILADILSYTEKIKKNKLDEIASIDYSMLNDPSLQRMIKNVKTHKDTNYIFITPDSVFNGKFKFDSKEFNQRMAQVDKKMNEVNKRMKELDFNIKFDKNYIEKNKNSSEFSIKVDPNQVKIEIPKNYHLQVPVPDLEIITRELSHNMDKGKKSDVKPGKPPIPKKDDFSFNMKFGGDNGEPFELNIHIPDVDSIVNANEEMLENLNFSFDMNMDVPDEEEIRNDNINHKKMNEINEKLTQITNKLKKNPERADEYQKEINRLNKELKKLYTNDSKE